MRVADAGNWLRAHWRSALSILLSVPALVYVVDSIALLTKGPLLWSERPLVLLDIRSILVFLVYAQVSSWVLFEAWRSSRDRVVGLFASLTFFALLVYWTGLLTLVIGVLPSV